MDYPYNSKKFKPNKEFNTNDSDLIIYISGPMSGIPGFNYKEFSRVSDTLHSMGYKVISPAQPILLSKGYDWLFCMKTSIALLLEANAIYFLTGHENSKGAVIEANLAKTLGYRFMNSELGVI